ncbi:MAG: hypothetical protein V3V92_05575 [Candidatus Hydrothermarchaeales archaeon]
MTPSPEEPATPDLQSHLDGLSLSSDEKAIADAALTLAKACYDKVQGTDYYLMTFECMKSAHKIRKSFEPLISLSKSDWTEVRDYVLIKSAGEPGYWTKDDTINLHDWKEMIPKKLSIGFHRYEDNDGNVKIHSDLSIYWRTFDLNEAQKLDVERARRDFWTWQNEQRKRDMLDKVSITVSGDSEKIAKEVMTILMGLRDKASKFDSSPSSDNAYELSYTLTLGDIKIEEYREYDYGVVKDASAYVVKYGPGMPQVYEDEFGDIKLGGLTVYDSSKRKRFRVYFNRHIDKLEKEANFWMHVSWDEEDREIHQDVIDQAREDAWEKSRKDEMDEKLQDYLNTFSISEENEKIAKDLVAELNKMVEELERFSPSTDAVYDLQYRIILLTAKVNGLGEAMDCSDLEQVANYVIVYTPGDVKFMERGGKLMPDNWKNLYTEEPASLNFNWVCKKLTYLPTGEPYSEVYPIGTPEPVRMQPDEEITELEEEAGYMSVNLNWQPSIFENDAYRDAIDRANEDTWEKAEKIRKQKLLIEAKTRFSFISEQKDVGEDIIEKLKEFEAKLLVFENTGEGLYELYYDYVLLNHEIQGTSEAYWKHSKEIGIYVMLYGPGAPDIWKDEFRDIEIGHSLTIHAGKMLKFWFYRYYDEEEGRGDFHINLDIGELSKGQVEIIRTAEKDAWEEAEQLRRKELITKLRGRLHPVGDVELWVEDIKEYVILVKKYTKGTASAYDVELHRLELNQQFSKLDRDTRDYIMIADLGEGAPLPHVDYNYETDEMWVSEWRDLISEDDELFVGIGSWCKEGSYCAIDLNMQWKDWEAVSEAIERANELFWREQNEKELSDDLAKIVSTKERYSPVDQDVEEELVGAISEISASCNNDDSAEEFQFKMLLKEDELNDLLDKAENEDIVSVALAEVKGYHHYDEREDVVRGLTVCTGNDYDVDIKYYETFSQPFAFEVRQLHEVVEGTRDLEVNVEVRWKVMDDDLAGDIEKAFERYEKEQSKVHLGKLVEKRTEVLESLSDEKVSEFVNAYEAGTIGADELRWSISRIFFALEGYDTEIAYLASLSGEPFPEFTPFKVKVKTDHVDMEIWEEDFDYKFGGGLNIRSSRLTSTVRPERPDIALPPPPKIVTKRKAKAMVEGVEITEEGEVMMATQMIPSMGEIQEATAVIETPPPVPLKVEREVEIEIIPEEVAASIMEEQIKAQEMKVMRIEEMRLREMELGSKRNLARSKRGVGGEKLKIEGIKPRLKLQVSLTDAEILRLAEELKERWLEAQETGVIDEMIYELNLAIDQFPAIQEAIRDWGDTTTSVAINHKEEPIFEFSFRTEDGRLVWAKYDMAEGAGSDGDNIYLEADFASLMKLRNWWEGRLKNAEGPASVVAAVPAFGARLTTMVLTGGIKIKPFGSVLKIPKFFKVFFNAMVYTTGVFL